VGAQAFELIESGRVAEALDLLMGYLEEHPDHVPARQLAAATLSWDGRPLEAAALLRAGLEFDPEYWALWDMLGGVEHQLAEDDYDAYLLCDYLERVDHKPGQKLYRQCMQARAEEEEAESP